jgi:transposase
MGTLKVNLTKKQREYLQDIVKTGTHSALTFRHTIILLNSDNGEFSPKISSETIQKVLNIDRQTVDRVRKRYREEGLEAAIERQPIKDGNKLKKVDSELENGILELYKTKPPEGCSKWSLRKLEKAILKKLNVKLSHETVRHIIKRTDKMN